MKSQHTWEDLTRHFTPEDRREIEEEKEKLRSELNRTKPMRTASMPRRSATAEHKAQASKGGRM